MARKPIPESDIIEFEDPNLKQGFAQVPRPVLKAHGLSDRAKVLYALLLDYAWREGSCFPGQSRLAEDLDVNERTIQRSLTELRDYKLINWKRRGLSQTNLYYILDLSKNPNLTASRGNGPTEKPNSTADTTNLSYQHPTKLSGQDPTDLSYKEYSEEYTQVEKYALSSSNPEISLSKFRKGTPKNFESEEQRVEGTPEPQPTPTGFTRLGSVLHTRPYSTEREEPQGRVTRTNPSAALAAGNSKQSATSEPTELRTASPKPKPLPAANSGTAASRAQKPNRGPQSRQVASQASRAESSGSAAGHSEERQHVAAYIESFAAEFHDQASVKSSTTRALRLLKQSGYPRERWSEKLYEARGLTRERSAAIGYQGDGQPHAALTGAGLVNKMPYYFELLACVLDRHDHPAGQHPLPLSAAEFRRQRNTGTAGGRQRGKVLSAPRRTLAEPTGEPERKSLAGRFAHLVQH